jgi:hypothetical protein
VRNTDTTYPAKDDVIDGAKNTVDADEAIREKNEDGAVVKRQPGVNTDQRDAVGGPYVQR